MLNNVLSSILLVFILNRTIAGESFLGPCPLPPNFPQGLNIRTQPYFSYGHEVNIPQAYIAYPRNPTDVVRVANWAHINGYRVRGSGSHHNWSPLTFARKDNGVPCPKVILLDTTSYLSSMELNPNDKGDPNLHSVTLGPGVILKELLEFLETNGLGLYSTPLIGAPTVGGMLAVGAHGSGVGSASLDTMSPGHSSGSFSNLVIQMTIVAWNNQTSSYELRTLHRSQKECKAFLTNFGRTFVTSVAIRVGLNQNLHSQTHIVSSSELFADPQQVTDSTRTLSKFIQTYGRVNLFSIPPSNKFWVYTTHNAPLLPPKSRLIKKPIHHVYFPIPEFFIHSAYSLIQLIPPLRRLYSLVPWIGNAAVFILETFTRTNDVWGPSKNHFFIMGNRMPHNTDNPFMVVTSRNNLQAVVHVMRKHYEDLSAEFQNRNEISTPGGFTFLRIASLDNPDTIGILGAEAPSFSPLKPIPEYPHFDTGVWMDTAGFTESPEMYELLVRLQTLLYRDLHGRLAIIRAEWSNGWAFTREGAWRNSTVLEHFARTFSSSNNNEEWNWAVETLDNHDPHKVFSNSFLDEFLTKK